MDGIIVQAGQVGSATSDALNWIAAVEVADGEPLESGVKDAMIQFVSDLKTNSIWDSIETMTVQMGARTLAGALIDVKDPTTSWLNNNFVSGDYDRRLGLIGDGSTKYLDTQWGATEEIQNNAAIWMVLSDIGVSSPHVYMGQGGGSLNGTTFLGKTSGTVANLRNQSNNNNEPASSLAVGFLGMTRDNSSTFDWRGGGNSATITRSSQAPISEDYYCHATANSGAQSHSNGRIQIAALGTAHDLSIADTVTAAFITAISDGIFAGLTLDTDAEAWIDAVEVADGEPLESSVKFAMNQLVLDLKSNSIWTALTALNVNMGARTLAGALIEVKNPTTSWTNNGFVSGDYSRTTGLIGDGSSKYLNSGVDSSSLGQDDRSLWLVASSLTTGGTTTYYCGNRPTPDNGPFCLRKYSAGALRVNNVTNNSTYVPAMHAVGFMGTSRFSSASFNSRGDNTNFTKSTTSRTPIAGDIYFFCTNDGATNQGYSDHRQQAAAVGADHNLELADNCISTYISSVIAAI